MNRQKKLTAKNKNLYKYKNETLLKELDGLVEDILLPFQDSKALTKTNSNKNLNTTYAESDNSHLNEFDLLTHRFENDSGNQEQGLNKQKFLNNPEEILVRDFDDAQIGKKLITAQEVRIVLLYPSYSGKFPHLTNPEEPETPGVTVSLAVHTAQATEIPTAQAIQTSTAQAIEVPTAQVKEISTAQATEVPTAIQSLPQVQIQIKLGLQSFRN
ncbi:hypothetical protein C2G38_2213169 [Gigaspora rosea]|uniref:Uncharacterized protein n=1 Tax=Gigaspora rosea TaxID=44941 RepID=A0A397UC74_9GLOM|nr:hypothetical protein C2G38_2213169 [Gigaspora rosea]